MQEQHNTEGGVHGLTHPTSSSSAWEPLKPEGCVYIFGPIYSLLCSEMITRHQILVCSFST